LACPLFEVIIELMKAYEKLIIGARLTVFFEVIHHSYVNRTIWHAHFWCTNESLSICLLGEAVRYQRAVRANEKLEKRVLCLKVRACMQQHCMLIELFGMPIILLWSCWTCRCVLIFSLMFVAMLFNWFFVRLCSLCKP
jgi:hypothetical protein